MAENPIKYSDLIQADGSIEEAISSLEKLASTYDGLAKMVKEHAITVKASMQSASGATNESRATLKKAVEETSRLEKAQNELAFAMSEVGAEVANLKRQTADANRESKIDSAAVEAKRGSYNQLKSTIDMLVLKYKGLSKEQALNTAYGRDLQSTIVRLKTELKQVDAAIKINTINTKKSTAAKREAKVVVSDLEKAKMKLAAATSAETTELLQLMMQTKEANQVSRLNVIIANEVEGSYNRLSAQYSLNKIALNKMSMAERETSASGKQLVKETNDLYQNMIKLQEATGKHSLSVGNYRRAWDGLGMSVNQIMREVPAAGISLNTFFLAISNNVPILVDEIEKVSAANKVAAKEGLATTNIWKSVLKAVFSWQSMLVIIITVFSMYGKQIFQWVGNLMKAKKAIDAAKLATEQLSDAGIKGRQDAAQDITRLRLLYNATVDTTKGLNNRLAAVKELKKEYPAYFKDLKDEEILAGKAADKYNMLTAAILNSAMARAKEDKIIENAKKIAEIEEKRDLEVTKMLNLEATYLVQKEKTVALDKLANDTKMQGYKDQALAAKNLETYWAGEYGRSIKRVTNLSDEMAQYEKANERIAKGIKVADLVFDPTPTKETKGDKKENRAEQIEKANLDIKKRYAETVTDLELNELKKREKQLNDSFIAEKLDLENKQKNDKDLTAESRAQINEIIKNLEIKLKSDLELLDLDKKSRTLQIEEEMLQLRLEASERGSKEENDIRLQLLQNGRQQELTENKKLIEGERQSESDIHAKWDALALEQDREYWYNAEMLALDSAQAIAEAEFLSVRRSEYEKSKFKLEQEKERQEKLLQLVKAGTLKISEAEVAIIEAALAKIGIELNNLKDKKFDFYSMLGIKLEDDEKEAIQKTIDATVKNLQNILAAQIELADVSIQKASERTEAAKTNLQNEIDARNEGYASSVAQAQRDLELERKTLEKAQKEKERAVKAQQALDTVLQTTSLITASAGIWKSFAGLGPLGPAFAIAALAAMWGSFAISKVKAAQVTKAQTYGEGGYEMLEGGSHASGNDINIGKTATGADRRAEGGEMLAIVNKSNTKKYRSILPDVINSLNKGIFEHKYMRSYNIAGLNNLNINMPDSSGIKQLESDVKAIREQGERKYLLENGKVIEKYKNLTRIYKS